MSLWERWKKVSINNKLMIYMTAILAVATTLYTLMYRSQVKFIEQNAKQSAEQTDRLIAASERLAETTRGTLEETKRVNEETAARADRNTKAIETQANASLSQAKTSQVSAGAAEKSAQIASRAMIIQARPYMGTATSVTSFAADQPLVMDLIFINDGNSTATVLNGEYSVTIRGKPEAPTDSSGTKLDGITILPHRTRRVQIDTLVPIRESELTAIKNQKRFLFILGRGIYDGIGGRVPFGFCYVYFKKLDGFGECSDLPNLKKTNQ